MDSNIGLVEIKTEHMFWYIRAWCGNLLCEQLNQI